MYGFCADPKKPPSTRALLALGQMPAHKYFSQSIHNLAYHNLCTTKQPPPNLGILLGLGLKFVVQKPLPKPDYPEYISRFFKDVRTKFMFGDTDDDTFNPKLWVKNENFTPEAAPQPVEDCLQDFNHRLRSLLENNKPFPRHNLNPNQRKLLRELRQDRNFVIVPTDKNLGPAIMERSTYKRRCLLDHLFDSDSYKQVSKEGMENIRAKAIDDINYLLDDYGKDTDDGPAPLSAAAIKYFTMHYKMNNKTRRLPQFYITPKVHKTPWATRPIVSCVGSHIEVLSKYLDHELQKVTHLCPGYLKDSQALLEQLNQLGPLPPGAKLFTADAVSMYTNIDTDHGIKTIQQWLILHKHELPTDFPPIGFIVRALKIVMKQNVFQLDDTFWKQEKGTAMGTSVACLVATIYYAYHEETKLIPKYGSHPKYLSGPLLFYRRFIDDLFGIWVNCFPHIGTFHESLLADLPFGKLTWTATTPGSSVVFLDLTLTIMDTNLIESTTYVKPNNLHLYLPPSSAHAPGVWKSLIYGNLRRYWSQNSNHSDYTKIVNSFFHHLINRGHTPEQLQPLFMEAAAKIDSGAAIKSGTGTKSTQQKDRVFLHWEFHPNCVHRKEIQQAFTETCRTTLTTTPRETGLQKPAGIKQLTIAYSNQDNLRKLLTRTQLDEPEGERVSSLVEEMKTELGNAPS